MTRKDFEEILDKCDPAAAERLTVEVRETTGIALPYVLLLGGSWCDGGVKTQYLYKPEASKNGRLVCERAKELFRQWLVEWRKKKEKTG